MNQKNQSLMREVFVDSDAKFITKMNRSISAPGSLPPISNYGCSKPSFEEQAPISHRESDKENREMHFPISLDTIGDLMIDIKDSDTAIELRKLQQVLLSYRIYLEQLYIVVGKSRRDFSDFVMSTSGIEDPRTANEIFSIATDRFAAEEDLLGHGSDCTMSRVQFATAIVRLANFDSLCHDGCTKKMKLSKQVNDFLQKAKDDC